MNTDAIGISLFAHRLNAICEEMGAILKRSAVSPNIKDREDFSCALFDINGDMVAQAAHIPVHLGSMAFAMREITGRFDWQPGDILIFNDPFSGGTHLPDVTVLMPIFLNGSLAAFAAARAHHADIGGKSPGSMGVEHCLSDEGLIITPRHWFRAGREQDDLVQLIRQYVRAPDERLADLAAQKAACQLAEKRLRQWAHAELSALFAALMRRCEAYGRQAIAAIPDGTYRFKDILEDDGVGHGPLPIQLQLTIDGELAFADFSGTADQSPGPVNCPLPVTAASVYYVFRCLMPSNTPQSAAVFRPIELFAPEGCLLNASPGAAVAAGNVETSQRIVDVLLGALAQAIPERIPAASQGTMNNVIFGGVEGGKEWVYYETLGGGMGAHASGPGLSAVQCHMTNTRNTSIEVLEMHYPLRIRSYAIRRDSGGAGMFHGGDGIIREWEALADCHLSLLSERRQSRPYGLHGGKNGQPGRNQLLREGRWQWLPAKISLPLKQGERLRIETPGGGGFGWPETNEEP